MTRRRRKGALKQAVLDDAIGLSENTLPIAGIRTDGGTQPRKALDLDVVEEYASNIDLAKSRLQGRMIDKNGFAFAPVAVYYDGETHWLVDGFHRLNAAKDSGLDHLEANIFQGTLREARLHSYGVNADHGKRRTNEDKVRAVDAMLRDEEWVGWSNRKIARACRVSHTMVNDRRILLERARQIQEQEERVGADGVVQRSGSRAKSRASKAKVEAPSTTAAAPLVRRNGALVEAPSTTSVEVEARPTPQVEFGEALRGETEEANMRMPDLPEQTGEVAEREGSPEKGEKWGLDVYEPVNVKAWYQVSERLEEARWVLTPLPEARDLVDALRYPANVNLQARAYVDVGTRRWIVWGEEGLPDIAARYEDMGGLEQALGLDGGQG